MAVRHENEVAGLTAASGDTEWGALVFDSRVAGWQSLEMRRWRQFATVDTTLAPDTDQLVTTLLSGWKRVEVRHGSRWDRAVIGPGTVSTTPPGQTTRLRWWSGSPEPLDHLSVRLPSAVMREAAAEMRGRRGGVVRSPDALASPDALLPRFLLALFDAARSQESELYAASAAEFLAVHLLVKHAGATPSAPTRPEAVRVERMKTLLRDRLTEPVLLDELADDSGLSRWHALRVFQKATGETPNRYLTRMRMELARQLLGSTRLSVTEISRRCGYAHITQFSRAFHRETGQSPTDYRAGRQ